MTPTNMAYRKMAAESVSGLGLMIALYDTLAGDLQRAASAQRINDVERRCREMGHAFMVIAHLEHCLRLSPGGELTEQLTSFYKGLRARLMEAQAKQSAQSLDREAAGILKIRTEWQKLDLAGSNAGPDMMKQIETAGASIYTQTAASGGRGGWSA